MQKTWIFVLGILAVIAIAVTAILSRPQMAPQEPDGSGGSVQTPGQNTAQPAVSASGSIKVTSPLAGATVGLPLEIKGEARVFENVVNWRLKDAKGNVLVESFGEAQSPDVGEFGPFTISSSYPKPTTANGVVEVFVYSAKDGSETDTVAIPVRFGDVSAMDVKVYFIDNEAAKTGSCTTVQEFSRRVPSTTAVARAAMDELLKGIFANEVGGRYGTEINRGVVVQSLSVSGGVATVTLSPELQTGVAGSCRVAAIRAQIEKTLLQFPTVQSVVIRVDGVPDAEVLQP